MAQAESLPEPDAQPATSPYPSPRRSALLGARAGFLAVTYVLGPICAAFPVVGLAITAFGVGAGRGWSAPRMLLGAVWSYFVFAALGAILGALPGLIGARLRRARPESRLVKGLERAQRPMHLRPIRAREVPAQAAVEATSRRGRRPWAWLLAAAVLLVLAAAFGAGVYAGRVVNGRLAAAVAAADRDDPHWRLDDLLAHRAPVPDDQNAALVVAEALSVLPEGWPRRPDPPEEAPDPPPADIAGFLDGLPKRPNNVRLDDATAAAIRAELDTYAEAVQLARGVAEYDRGRHELELGPTLIDTPLEETQATRDAARLLVADAALRAHDGDPDGTLDSCRAVLGVGRSIGDEPFLISQLVRVAIGSAGMQAARRALAQGEPSDAAMARLQALLFDERAQPLLHFGMRGERATLTELIRRIGAGEVPISALGDTPVPGAPIRAVSSWGRLWFDHQRAVALEWMNDAVAIARRPSHEWPPLWKAWDDRVDRTKESRLGLYTATLPLLLAPALSAAGTAHMRYQAELGATAILLAAERHRRRTGNWPASVAAIDRTILPDPPLDPFTGRAYRLELRDGQIVIYTLGPNGRDEHGEYEPRRMLRGDRDDIGARGWDVPLRRRPPPPDPPGEPEDRAPPAEAPPPAP